jgi:glycosyltransferase involved in cell wall biosynthesis
MSTKRTFSIAIPAFNGEAYLETAILSALHQTRPADQIVIVVDKSQDSTNEICQKYKDHIEIYYNDSPSGFVDAWNRVIDKCTCDFVSILHQDDLLDKDYLAHIEKAAIQFPDCQHFYAACNYINEEGIIIRTSPVPCSLKPEILKGKEYALKYLISVSTGQHIHRCPGVTTARDLLVQKCSYRREAGHIADDDFFYRVGMFTDVAAISQPLASFRIHSNSVTGLQTDLTSILIEDYLFQIKYHQDNLTLFSPMDRHVFYKIAYRLMTRLLVQAIIFQDTELYLSTFKIKAKMDQLPQLPFGENLSFWGKILWFLSPVEPGSKHIYCFSKIMTEFILVKSFFLKKKRHPKSY